MEEKNKAEEKLKISFKDGFVYFLLIQLEVLAVSTFITMLITLIIRFIFTESGTSREIAESVGFLITEMLILFFIFFGIFKNNRNLTYKQFLLNYLFTFALRLVFSLVTSFSAWSAGMSVCLTGKTLARIFVDKDILTMQQVPIWLYIIVFLIYEAITILVAFLSYKLSAHIRKKERDALLSETNESEA